jgi:hypothetical protein
MACFGVGEFFVSAMIAVVIDQFLGGGEIQSYQTDTVTASTSNPFSLME